MRSRVPGAAEPDSGDAGDDEAGEAAGGDEPAGWLSKQVERREQVRRRRGQRGEHDRPGQFARALSGEPEHPDEQSEPDPVDRAAGEERATRETNSLIRIGAALGGQGSGGDRGCARPAVAMAPPVTATACSVWRRAPARPASLVTEAVKRASAAAEMSWPATLKSGAREGWVK